MKERLTGAIILVVLIVLLVPELLSGPSKSAIAPQSAVQTAQNAEEPPLRSYTIDLADESHSATSSGTTAPSAQASGPAQPTAVEPPATTGSTTASAQQAAPAASEHTPPPPVEPQSAPQQTPPSTSPTPSRAHGTPVERRHVSPPPPPAAHPAESAGSAGGWVVQVGVFANRTNADRLAQELKEKGFRAQVSASGGGARPLWRVRSGPVVEHAAAEQLSARLRAAGHPGSVVPK